MGISTKWCLWIFGTVFSCGSGLLNPFERWRDRSLHRDVQAKVIWINTTGELTEIVPNRAGLVTSYDCTIIFAGFACLICKKATNTITDSARLRRLRLPCPSGSWGLPGPPVWPLASISHKAMLSNKKMTLIWAPLGRPHPWSCGCTCLPSWTASPSNLERAWQPFEKLVDAKKRKKNTTENNMENKLLENNGLGIDRNDLGPRTFDSQDGAQGHEDREEEKVWQRSAVTF